jgi:hypothetical protein
MRLTEQNYQLLRKIIVEAIHTDNLEKAMGLENELKRLKSLNPKGDFKGAGKIDAKIDDWLKTIAKGGGGLSKENPKEFKSDVAAAEAFIKMFSEESFEDALLTIQDGIGPSLYTMDAENSTLKDIASWTSLGPIGEVFGSSIGKYDLSARRNKQPFSRGAKSNSSSNGNFEKPKLTANALKDQLVLNFKPVGGKLDGFLGMGGNQKFLEGLANSMAEAIMNFTVKDLKKVFMKYFPGLSKHFSKKESEAGIRSYAGLENVKDSPVSDMPSANTSLVNLNREEPTDTKNNNEPRSGKTIKQISSEIGLNSIAEREAAKKLLKYLKANGLLDPEMISEIKKHVRRGRTKIVLNENLTRYKIFNY